jgi:RND family efflux transporter MFP subunit
MLSEDGDGRPHSPAPTALGAPPAKRRRRRHPWIRWVALVLLVAGAGYGYQRYRAGQSAGKLPPGVQVAGVERQTLEQTITATGVVSAQTGAQVKIGAQLSGRIKRLTADVGQIVRAGDTIAELDLPDLEATVRQARDSVNQAESRFHQAIENASWTKEQTEEEVRNAQAAVNAAEARLHAAKEAASYQPEQTQSEIERAHAARATAESSRKQVLASIQLQLNQAQATIDSNAADLHNLQRQLDRGVRLQSRGLLPQESVDNLRTQVAQARARLASSRSNYGVVQEKTEADRDAAENVVRQAEANLRVAKAGTHQDERMRAEQESAQQALAQARAQLQLSKSNLRQQKIRDQAVNEAQASLQQSRNQFQYQEEQMKKAFIRAPITGTVVSIAAQQGETVAAAFAAPTLIIVTDLKRLEVKAYVDETDVGKVHLGLPSQAKVDSFPSRAFKGKVTKIAAASTIKDNVVTYETTIALENPEGLLKPDMTAAVEIFLDRRPDVLSIPSEAVKREGEQEVVYVLPKGAPKPVKRVVKTGLDNGSDVEIVSGLKGGESVVLAGLEKYGIQSFTSRR